MSTAVELVQEEGRPELRILEYLAKLHWLASRTQLVEREWEQARYHLVRAVELTPDDPTPRYSLVEMYEGMGDYASGWSLLKRTLPNEPDRFGPLFNFALRARRHGESEMAVSYFREIRDHDEIGIFRELSDLYLAAPGRPDPTPEAREALWREGSSLLHAGLYDRALQKMTELLSWDITHGGTWACVGYLYEEQRTEQQEPPRPLREDAAVGFPVPFQVASTERQNDLRRAAQAYRMALVNGAQSAEVHHRLANTYLNMGFPRQALEHARRAAELAPDNASTSVNLANNLMENGELSEALPIVDGVLQKDPRHAVAYLVMGRIADRLGDRKAADALFAAYRAMGEVQQEDNEPGT